MKEISEREILLKEINVSLDRMDNMVKDGILTRRELTEIVLRRNILAMKRVFQYMKNNLGM